MSMLTIFEATSGKCVCGGQLPSAPAYKSNPTACSYWCHQVETGQMTLEQITPWLRTNRAHT